MRETTEVAVGDWVRFVSAGELKIGAVQYLREETDYPHKIEIVTDAGICHAHQVLEIRSVPATPAEGAQK